MAGAEAAPVSDRRAADRPTFPTWVPSPAGLTARSVLTPTPHLYVVPTLAALVPSGFTVFVGILGLRWSPFDRKRSVRSCRPVAAGSETLIAPRASGVRLPKSLGSAVSSATAAVDRVANLQPSGRRA